MNTFCAKILIRLTTIVGIVLTIPLFAFPQGSMNVPLLGTFNPYAATGYNDCWGYTAVNGREYALLGVRNGTSIIDITDAPILNEVAFIPSVVSLWKDIKTYQTYAYVVTDGTGEGIQIIDLSMLPDTAVLVTTFAGTDLTSHNLSIDTTNGILYAQGGAGLVRVVDLSDPENPEEIPASFDGLTHCHDILIQGNKLFISEGSSGTIAIFDVSNPASPVLLSRFGPPDSGYVHNAWPSPDGTLLMTTEETPGKTVKLWDISTADTVWMADDYLAPEGLAHNVHVKGSHAYISHYKDGLRIVNISNPNSIFEEGHYDTYDSTLAGNFHGAWGAFPFFNSGKVLISDMESGLFVVYFAGSVVKSETQKPGLPEEFSLSQNYPNPFNPATVIPYEVAMRSRVRFAVYNVLGKEIAVLLDEVKDPGAYTLSFDAGSLPSGVYFYRMSAGNTVQTRRMLFVR
ncbi:MAG: choice-of-anchor B family protein [Bacteroidota bacterium]